MSGGSYNYLCYADDLERLLGKQNELERMSERLIELGYKDAAKETYQLLLKIQSFEVQAETIQKRLEGVWKAVEWMDSLDSGPDDVDAAIDKYRGNKT